MGCYGIPPQDFCIHPGEVVADEGVALLCMMGVVIVTMVTFYPIFFFITRVRKQAG